MDREHQSATEPRLPLGRTTKTGLSVIALCLAATGLAGGIAAAQPVPPVETETVRLSPVIRKLELSGTVSSPHASQISPWLQDL
ncbi:hypothetical protein [Methyloceanibacter sp. wino2]|uniref:hypothetical protein n=1 Tax=Methyloceanibacter sp. wino2 TaxID=2170729 RepID=UPI00131F0D57|nr:hypothetical protein [Methyloceanibacter sp. wino2]